MANGVRCSISTKNSKKYNPHTSKLKLMVYRILSNKSTYENSKNNKNKRKSSFIGEPKTGAFLISEEVEKDYRIYKSKKEESCKKRMKSFSFYNNDGSFNCIGIFLGMCSDYDYIREKSSDLFFMNVEKIIKSDDFRDLITLIFTSSTFLYLYFTLFFNFREFINYKFNFIL